MAGKILSEKFFGGLKNTGEPYYKIAWGAGLTPNQMYKITSGVDRPSPDDSRVQSICSYIGITIAEAFEDRAA